MCHCLKNPILTEQSPFRKAKCSHHGRHHGMPELRPADSQSLLGILFLNEVVCNCQYYVNYLFPLLSSAKQILCIYDVTLLCVAGNSRHDANERPASRQGGRQGRVRDCTFILDAKLTMVRCFSLFCWAVLSSGRLSLLAAQAHPPQKSRHKIKLDFFMEWLHQFPSLNLLLNHGQDSALIH